MANVSLYDGPEVGRHMSVTETEKNSTYVKYASPSHTREKPFDLHDGEVQELRDWANSDNPRLSTLVPIIQRMKRRTWGAGVDDGASTSYRPAQYIERQREAIFLSVIDAIKDEQLDMCKSMRSSEIEENQYMLGYWNSLQDILRIVSTMKQEQTGDGN